MPNGKVYGKDTNLIMSSGNLLSTDLSREFGAYGGKPVSEGDLFTRKLHYGRSEHLKGTTAVITTKGHANFHHWNYDCLPRLQMLREAGLLDQVDRFLIRHQGQRFQLESLARMGLPLDRIHALPEEDMLITSDVLLVPSLPSVLGTVSPWVTDFLAGLYDPDGAETSGYERIFLSRKKVTTRQIVNQAEFKALLEEHGIRELFPEDHSVAEMARIVVGARFVISAHGSGLSNLCFLKPGAVVVDILMPHHQDAYYWQITNIRGGRYIGFFGAGEHPDDDVDLVANKIDEDIHIDMEQMRTLLNRELKGG